MNAFRSFTLATLVALCLAGLSGQARAQVAEGIGPEPVCPYGFYDVPPYACAPYGYYGPDWFADGLFIGAGPWSHGSHDFHEGADHRSDEHLAGIGHEGFGGHEGGFSGHAGGFGGHEGGFGGHGGGGGHGR